MNRPVTVSSGAATATNAVDGNSGTAWVSANTQNEWIYVDLGSVFNLTGAQLNWGTPYGQSYDIQVSSDGVNWTNVFETPDGFGGNDRITFVANGRYVKMLGVQSSKSGYAVSEFQVFGNTTPLMPPAPTSLTATTISSSQINLSWAASANATGYNVKESTISGGPYTLIATNISALTYPNFNLTAGTTYYFVVSATNSYGESVVGEVSAETIATNAPQLSLATQGGEMQLATGGRIILAGGWKRKRTAWGTTGSRFLVRF